MSRDYLKGKKCMVWSFMGNTRMHQALNNYGDRFEAVGIFTFEVDISGTITETGTPISSMMPYINKWPKVRWFLTVMNHGTASIFTALRNNENGAKTKFLSELVRIMQKYPGYQDMNNMTMLLMHCAQPLPWRKKRVLP
jgi:hypothetical protein